MSGAAVSWLKLPIVGAPGAQCGRRLLEGGGGTEEQSDFKQEFGECDADARWMIGWLFVCQEHAAKVAADFGDDIEEIEKAWRAQL